MHRRPLDETTWPDFAALVERHNGMWDGCWCMAFHPEGVGRTRADLRGLVPVRAAPVAAALEGGLNEIARLDRTRRIGKQHGVATKLVRAVFRSRYATPKAPQRHGRDHGLVIATILALLTFAVFAALVWAGNHQH